MLGFDKNMNFKKCFCIINKLIYDEFFGFVIGNILKICQVNIFK